MISRASALWYASFSGTSIRVRAGVFSRDDEPYPSFRQPFEQSYQALRRGAVLFAHPLPVADRTMRFLRGMRPITASSNNDLILNPLFPDTFSDDYRTPRAAT